MLLCFGMWRHVLGRRLSEGYSVPVFRVEVFTNLESRECVSLQNVTYSVTGRCVRLTTTQTAMSRLSRKRGSPRRFTTLSASTACYRNSALTFSFTLPLFRFFVHIKKFTGITDLKLHRLAAQETILLQGWGNCHIRRDMLPAQANFTGH
jgi:hypothetical protein